MPSPQIERKLAAIMFTDIAGYTALSAKDSTKASELLKTQRDTLKPIVEKYGGSWMKEIGDGLLLTFDSATSAVECSIAIQEATKDIEDLNLRIGIHEGEVIKQDDDVIGDDVNVASRIEPFSAVGGVAITHKIEQAISSNKEFETKYIGKPKLKGVAQEIKVFCITSHGLPKTDISKVSAKLEEESKFNIFALTGGILTAIGIAFWIAVGVFDVSFGGKVEVPSVGILMMENLGKEDEEFWSNGMTADLITRVAGAGLIRVAPIDDILKLDKDLSIEEKARKLRVKYILTHSFLIKDDSFDLWCKLENVENGVALFSNKISEPMDMATQMVGKLANDIVTSLKVKTKQDVMKAPTANVEAYEYYLKAKYKYENPKNIEDVEIARGLLQKAILLDDRLFLAKWFQGHIEYGIAFDKPNSEYEKSMGIYESLLNQGKNISDQLRAKILNDIGLIQYQKANYNQAISYYNNAKKLAIKVGDLELENSIIHNFGLVYTMLEQDNKALSYFNKALKIFDNIGNLYKKALTLKNIGNVYYYNNKNNEALDYYLQSKNLFDKIGNNTRITEVINNIGFVYLDKGNYDKALDYFNRSLKIYMKLGSTIDIGMIYYTIGNAYDYKIDFEASLDYYSRAFEIYEKLGDKRGMGQSLMGIGNVYANTGDYDKALDYYVRLLKIAEELGDKYGVGNSLNNIGTVYFSKSDYEKSLDYLDKSLAIQKELGFGEVDLLETTTYLYLTYKHLGKEYDENEIHSYIKSAENIDFEINLRLYELLEDKSYLETAYKQVQEKALAMDDELLKKGLSYPIPKAIVEEWEKVK